MSGDRGFELLSAAADDDLSEAERKELEQLLEVSADARRLQAEFAELESAMSNAPELDPPPGLREAVLSRVSLPEPETTPSFADRLFDQLRTFRVGLVLRYGFSAACGALLAIAVYESQPNFGGAADIDDLVGTMAPDSKSANRKILDSFSFVETGLASTVRLERRDDALVVDVRIETARPVDIEIDFTDAIMEFEALAQTFKRLDSIQFSDRVLKVRGQGDRRFAVLLRPRTGAAGGDEATIRLQYTSDGVVVRQGVLRSIR